MSEEFKIEIVNPEKSFLVKEDVSEVVVPAFEGEMGILKDHISIISFLKPGIIKILSKSGDENYYVEDGIIELAQISSPEEIVSISVEHESEEGVREIMEALDLPGELKSFSYLEALETWGNGGTFAG